MAKIANIKDNGEVVYPITKPECVINENGKNVLQLIKETKVDDPVVIYTEKLGNPVYSDKDGMGWSTQQVENAFGMPYAEIYEAIKKRGVVYDNDTLSLYAFQSMEQDGSLIYCFNVSTADSKTKSELWLAVFETPETVDDIEVAIIASSFLVHLSYDDTEVKAELARLEEEKADKPFIFSAEKLGDPIYQKDEDGQGEFAYTKEQVETAFGMSTAEIYEELKTRDAVLDLGIKALPCTRYDTAMDGLIMFYYYWPTFGQGSAEYSLSFYVEPTKIVEGVEANLVINVTYVDHTAESSVFEAIYGETTYDAIVAAFNAKKHVLCIWNDRVYNLSAVTSTLLNFSCTKDSVIYIASCKNDNVWGNLQYNVEHVRNKATSLTSAATDAQYPSAKAVYDFVNNTLGTIINGDY